MSETLMNRILRIAQSTPRVAILMSGQGSNAERILRARALYPNWTFVGIYTDQPDSRAEEIATAFDLPYVLHGGSVRTPELREAYFRSLSRLLEDAGVDLLVYAGFMKVSTGEFVRKHPGINSHPADLTIVNSVGEPKYVGMRAIADTLDAGESYIASTVHVVDSDVDCGQPIAVSPPLSLEGLDHSDPLAIHALLKARCEHVAYPYTLSLLARGRLTAELLPINLKDSHDRQEILLR